MKLKKLLAIVLAIAMILTLVTSFSQNKDTAAFSVTVDINSENYIVASNLQITNITMYVNTASANCMNRQVPFLLYGDQYE